MDRNQDLLNEMKFKLSLWFKDMIEKRPNLDDGESMSIEFSGGKTGYSDKDEELFDVIVRLTENRTL